MSKHLIIIGGVAAGTKAAAKARREDDSLKITLYTEDKHISYAGCGLPYFISDDIKSKEELLVRSPEDFKSKENINIHIKHRVTSIDPIKKEITVFNIKENLEINDEYDNLVIATGAYPIIPPIKGIDLQNIFTLRTINDAIEIKKLIDQNKVKRATIVGAGLIGLECAEAFAKRGLEVTVIELADQILSPFDKDMVREVQKHCIDKNIRIITSDGVKEFKGSGSVSQVITNNLQINTDIVILSIGVKPNISLASKAGIEIGQSGAIKVNKKMQTNIPNIYAAGDCVESTNLVTQKPTWVPLGSTANKQGRVAAINITGGHSEFSGVLGSLIVKVFDYTAAKTGLSEKEADKFGYDYESIVITGNDKARYYPNCKNITIKLLADKKTKKLLGSQIIGEGIVDKRIDLVAVALSSNEELKNIVNADLAYSPPYSMATDIILIAFNKLLSKLKT